MKKLFFLSLIIFTLTSSFFAQTVVDDVTLLLAKGVAKKMKKLPTDAKIKLSFITYDNGLIDTTNTYLGIKLTKTFAKNMRLSLANNKSEIKILFPEEIDKTLYEKYIYDEKDDKYWENYNNNVTPNYYLSAKYKLSDDFKTIQITNIQILPIPNGKYATNQPIALENCIYNITKEIDIKELQTLNEAVNKLNQSYQNLVDWQGTANFISLQLINSNAKTVDNSEIVVGKEYQISANLTEDAYIYAFFYDPMDKSFPYISMLYPYQNGQSTYSNKGNIIIPPGSSFIPDPPDGQVFIKIIATKEKLPITFAEEVDSEGYILAKFDDKNCTAFLEKLNKLDKSKVSTRQMTLVRVVK